MSLQFPLELAFRRHPSFGNLIDPGGMQGNRLLIDTLRHLPDEAGPSFLYLWGRPGCGKSHLLMASCRELESSSFYLPLATIEDLDVRLLEGMERYRLVCIDDIQRLAGCVAWEMSIFKLYNRIREERGRLVVTANTPPRELKIELADLKSRLMWGSCHQMHSLDDTGKRELLIQMAAEKGLELLPDAAEFLFRRTSRANNELVALIDALDHYSLVHQRKLTVPLLRNWLAEQKIN